MQVVGLVAPKETHVQEIKSIFRYLKGTLDFGLWYPNYEYFTLTTYTDAYWYVVLMIENVQVEEHSFWEII